MTEYKTLRVPVDAWETAKEQKEDAGITWGEQIVREDSPEIIEVVEAGELGGVDEDHLADVLAERLPERLARELEGRLR